MARLLRKAKQAGKNGIKYQFDLTLHSLENMPPGDSFYVAFKRGPKCTLSMEHSGLTGSVGFEQEVLSMIATIYNKKDGQGLEKKPAKLSVKEVKRKGEKPIGNVEIDLSSFVNPPNGIAEVKRLPLKSKVKGQASVVFTLQARAVRDRARTVMRAPAPAPAPAPSGDDTGTTTTTTTPPPPTTTTTSTSGGDRPLKHAYIPSDDEEDDFTFTARGFDSDSILDDDDDDDDTTIDYEGHSDDEEEEHIGAGVSENVVGADRDDEVGGNDKSDTTTAPAPATTTTTTTTTATTVAVGVATGAGAAAAAGSSRIQALEAELAQVKAQLMVSDDKRQALATEFAEHSDKVEMEIKEKDLQIEALNKELEATQTAMKAQRTEGKVLARAQEECERLEGRVADLEAVNASLKEGKGDSEALEKANADVEKYRTKYKESKRLCEVVEESRQELEDELESLQRKYDALQAAASAQTANAVSESAPVRRKRAPTLSATMTELQGRDETSSKTLSEYQEAIAAIVNKLKVASSVDAVAQHNMQSDSAYQHLKYLDELSGLADLYIQACQTGAASQAMTILAEANQVHASVDQQGEEMAQLTTLLIEAKMSAAEAEDGRLQAVKQATEYKRMLNKARTQKMALGQRINTLEVQLANAPAGYDDDEMEL